MKKQLLKSALIAVAGVGLLAGSGWALPTGYSWTNADYFALTDFTTSNVSTLIIDINAGYGSDFGFYTVDNVNAPTTIQEELLVYSKTDPKGGIPQYITFDDLGGGNWTASVGGNPAQSFDIVFGFYFKIYTGGLDDPTADYQWYTDTQFNKQLNPAGSLDTNLEHIKVAYNASEKAALIFLDDQAGGGDQDFNDKEVWVNDIRPVPEPATMLLFGTGIIGLAGVARRNRKNNG